MVLASRRSGTQRPEKSCCTVGLWKEVGTRRHPEGLPGPRRVTAGINSRVARVFAARLHINPVPHDDVMSEVLVAAVANMKARKEGR